MNTYPRQVSRSQTHEKQQRPDPKEQCKTAFRIRTDKAIAEGMVK